MKDEKKLLADEKNAKQERMDKRKIQAPCAFKAPDPRTGRLRDYYPAVACPRDCDHCGWNPEVKEKRVAKMRAELQARRRAEAKERARQKREKGAGK